MSHQPNVNLMHDGERVSTSNPLPVTDAGMAAGVGAPADVAATTDTGTFSLIALVKRGLEKFTTLLAHISAVGAPAATAATVQGVAYNSQGFFTRPANATAYTAGDAVGAADVGTPANAGSAIIAFAAIGPTAGSIIVTGADLRIDDAAVPAGMTNLRLHLYNAAPDAILDNAAWTLSSAGDRGKYLGFIDLGAPADMGATLFVQADQVNKQIKLAAAATGVWGVLQTVGAFTPTSGVVHTINLRAVAV